MSNLDLRTGDCIEVMRDLPDNSVGSIVTDPPYGLEFMGRSFDSFKPRRTTAPVPSEWYEDAGLEAPENTPEVSLLSFQGNLVKPDNWKEVLDGASPSYDSDTAWKNLYSTESDEEDEDEGEAPVKVTDMHHFEEWNTIWLREAYRILKPGGVIKIFNGTRTYHRVCSAVERVGFVIEDVQGWIYSCLSEDTEIFTRKGWVLGVDVQEGAEVLCWNPDSDMATFGVATHKTLQPYRGEMVTLTSDGLEQRLTPGHRVYHQVEGRWVVSFAEDLRGQVQVPTGMRGISVREPASQGLIEAMSEYAPGVSQASVGSCDYEGQVWCVTVPTGAFFARRLGKVFITGNSGFPKSMSIPKALQKSLDRQGKKDPDLVARYSGYGTALKPAVEMIIQARKIVGES